MRRLILSITLAVCAVAAHAAPPSDGSIEELLTLTNAEQLMAGMEAQYEPMMRQTIAGVTRGKTLTAEQQRQMEDIVVRTAKVLREEVSWAKMKPAYLRIYRESLTQEDVDGLVAFYKSPAGQSFIHKMPVVMQKTMTLMQDVMGPMGERLQREIAESLKTAPTSR